MIYHQRSAEIMKDNPQQTRQKAMARAMALPESDGRAGRVLGGSMGMARLSGMGGELAIGASFAALHWTFR